MKVLFYPLLLISVLMLSCSEPKSDGFTISGEIATDIGVDSVYVYENIVNQSPVIIARAPVNNGKFVLKGKTDKVQTAYVGDFETDALMNFILENESYTTKITYDELYVKGGKIHNQVLGHMNDEEYIEMGNKAGDLSERAMNMEDSEEKARLVSEVEKLQNKLFDYDDAALFKIIDDKNAPTEARLFALEYCDNYRKYDITKRRSFLDEFEQALGGHYLIGEYRAKLDQMEKTDKMKATVGNGKSYKPVTAVDLNGKETTLAETIKKNKYTLLEFWASWCAPCRAEIPHLKKAYKKYKPKGLEIYSVSIDSDENSWKNALKQENTSWIQLISKGKKGEKTLQSYGVDGIPASYLIDQNGTIVASNDELRSEALEETLKSLLN